MKKFILLAILVLFLIGGGISVVFLLSKNKEGEKFSGNANIENGRSTNTTTNTANEPTIVESAAQKAGKELSNNKCSGTGPGTLTHSPMDAEDFSIIIPYGLTAGGHVTPIDHQYFSPKDYKSARDSYEVYAMADSRLVDIGPRTTDRGTEYRMVFSMTCTFLYYYDLVTSLAPDIKAEYDRTFHDGRARIDIPVKAGQLIGRIGGQTLDFAVWDTEKPLTGFINPAHYGAEIWKRYTADPLDYYAPDLKALALSRYVRTAEPISGKIDYDVDGKLIGNWFQVGTNGYNGIVGEGNGAYWAGHFSVAPDLYDPKGFIISIGDFGGEAMQFAAKGNAPKPETVSMETGLVKYDLVQWSYKKRDGAFWDRMTLTKDPEFVPQTNSSGCALVQMLENRLLKMETFPGKICASVSGFSSNAKTFER